MSGKVDKSREDKMINYQTLRKKNRLVGEMSEKFTPKATINPEAWKTSIKMVPSLFYSS